LTGHFVITAAYGRPEGPVRTARGLEYDLFARTTRALRDAWPTRGENFARLAEAVADNARLWCVLAADVAGANNALPQALRAQLFYLYEFTAGHSRKVLNGTATVDVLIDINTAVMRGLRGEGGAR
jgi:flagellar protein FlaF